MPGVGITSGAMQLTRIIRGAELEREALREVGDARLHRRVHREAGRGAVRLDRRDVDDRPTRLGHARHRRPDEVGDAHEVLADERVLALGVDVEEVGEEPAAGVVHQDVDRAQLAGDGGRGSPRPRRSRARRARPPPPGARPPRWRRPVASRLGTSRSHTATSAPKLANGEGDRLARCRRPPRSRPRHGRSRRVEEGSRATAGQASGGLA